MFGSRLKRGKSVYNATPAYGHQVGNVEPDVVKKKLHAAQSFVAELHDRSGKISQFLNATSVYGEQCGQVSAALRSGAPLCVRARACVRVLRAHTAWLAICARPPARLPHERAV